MLAPSSMVHTNTLISALVWFWGHCSLPDIMVCTDAPQDSEVLS
jgi:hypothetical protein